MVVVLQFIIVHQELLLVVQQEQIYIFIFHKTVLIFLDPKYWSGHKM